VACRASSSTSAWLAARATITSTQRDRFSATSRGDSRVPTPIWSAVRKMAWPPSWVMPASKVTCVRSDGCSKYIAIVRPSSVWGRSPLRSSAFSSWARARIARSSSADQSSRVRKSLGISATDQRPDPDVREHLEQDSAQDAPVDDVRALDPARQRVEAALDLRDHAALDRPLGDVLAHLLAREP